MNISFLNFISSICLAKNCGIQSSPLLCSSVLCQEKFFIMKNPDRNLRIFVFCLSEHELDEFLCLFLKLFHTDTGSFSQNLSFLFRNHYFCPVRSFSVACISHNTLLLFINYVHCNAGLCSFFFCLLFLCRYSSFAWLCSAIISTGCKVDTMDAWMFYCFHIFLLSCLNFGYNNYGRKRSGYKKKNRLL